MKTLLGFSVWNKVDMIAWLLDGIQRNFDPETTDIVFHFDACTDGSQEAWNSCIQWWLGIKGQWNMANVHALASTTEVREVGGHNRILNFFMAGDYDLCLIAQDDQHFDAPPMRYLQNAAAKFPNLGIVGGRDAYGRGYSRFTGSHWSESTVDRRVFHGEFVPLPYMNSGPVAYTRKVVEQCGLLDEEFRAYYVWDDYGQRALDKGFISGVMGMDLTHAKFGRVKATEWSDWSAHDLALRQKKHGW